MLKIRHRVNTIRELKATPFHLGVELDLRNEGPHLMVQHDPFKPGERFSFWLKHFQHAFLIVNIKSEGLEEPALALLKKCGIKNYFLLDLSFPALVRLVRKGEDRIAVRFSEYEPLESCLALKGKVRWAWIDCFTQLPLNDKNYPILKKHFKLCLVSPELEHHSKGTIALFRKKVSRYEIDALCTRYPERW